MFQGRMRRVGNSLVVTVPRHEAVRLGLTAGDPVAVEIAGVESRLRFPFPDEVLKEMRELAERNKPVLLLLKD